MVNRASKKLPAVEGVSAVERALAVLAAFRRGDTALSLAELAERDRFGEEHHHAACRFSAEIPLARAFAGRKPIALTRRRCASAPPISRRSACPITSCRPRATRRQDGRDRVVLT